MSYAELGIRVSASEYEMWLALAMVRQDECPHCGVEPRDLMDYGVNKIKCPVCSQHYQKVQRLPTR